MTFDPSFEKVLARIDQIDPVAYAKTRNYGNGAVSYLSPYISRGIISTKFILHQLLDKGYSIHEMDKFIQELAWRDYWQQIWISKGDLINKDLKREQPDFHNKEVPVALTEGQTGIHIIDRHIDSLKNSGYMHNHMRMYAASIACNIGKSHWRVPAQWMYYHLLDGDWASNALSWQWIAGANANKKYYANQENINTFFDSNQQDTFLDVPYEAFDTLMCPEVLSNTHKPELKTVLPQSLPLELNFNIPTLIYNYYNLDPNWRKTESANRVLLLEPSTFKQYPVTKQCIDFALSLKENIPGIQLFVGEFDDLINQHSIETPISKEHPLNKHYKGQVDERDWMFDVKGYYPSFFAFWKCCKKEMKTW